ncbi:MAG: hypothetical protein Q9202_000211 [Teloschistes flavicans]
MGAGSARINAVTIIQTSQGLAEYLLLNHADTAKAGIVVGYDARYNSRHYAELAATVFESKGIKVWWYEEIVHTPLVPFAVKTFEAAAGIMVTASHNPAQDNGYKVFGSNGCQINSPEDSRIVMSINQNLEPLIRGLQVESKRIPILQSAKNKYFSLLGEQIRSVEGGRPRVPFVYTPMHGVGLRYMSSVPELLGMKGSMTVVAQQAEPDPDFPTVKYPNPEEKGALDLAFATADKENVTIVLANDPDADRFAAAEKVDHVWRQFTGDQMGILLSYWLFSSVSERAASDDYFLTSAVSSQMLRHVAETEGFSVRETLTGFKWMGSVAKDLREQGKRVHFCYEEALGYMFPEVGYDKDGIAAALVFLDACASWGSPWAKLQSLYEEYGYFQTMNTYWRSPNMDKTLMVFASIRDIRKPFPEHVSSRKVLRWRDLTLGYDSSTKDHVPELPVSTASQMITCWLDGSGSDDGVRFTVRGSGTEPKIKSKGPRNLMRDQKANTDDQYIWSVAANSKILLVKEPREYLHG